MLLPHPTWKCQSPCRGIPSLCTYYCLQCEAALMSMQEEASLQLSGLPSYQRPELSQSPGNCFCRSGSTPHPAATKSMENIWQTQGQPYTDAKEGRMVPAPAHQLFSISPVLPATKKAGLNVLSSLRQSVSFKLILMSS